MVQPVKAIRTDKCEKFIRLVKVDIGKTHFDAWQPEILTVENDKIIKRELVGKPDVWHMAYIIAQELIDPRTT